MNHNMIDSDKILTMLEDAVNDAMKLYRYAYMLPDKCVAEKIQNEANRLSVKFIDIAQYIKDRNDE